MNATPALSEQLAAAAQVLHAVQQGRSLTEAMPRVPAALRPGVQALVYHGLRHWGEARVWTGLLADRPPPAEVAALLGLALTLLAPDDPEALRYAPHTVVDQAVQACERLRGAAGGFVNACLRRFLREGDALRARAHEDAEARWNHPFWWVKQLRRDHPAHWQALLQANQRAAPMLLRVNRRRRARDAYLNDLQAAGHPGQPLGPDGVVLQRAVAVERLPGWAEGWVSVQDGAAQLAAPLLLGAAALAPGARVLDACAAPGGKTAHLLEAADLDVWALDVDAARAQRIRDNLDRLGLRARVLAADAAEPDRWWDGEPFDAILLDAPCTASGIVRRHPDVRWLRRPGDIPQLAAQQKRLLEALWPTLRPGGHLLYCTCSVFRAEGAQQMDAFAQRHPEAQRLPAPGHLLPGTGWAAATGQPAMHDNADGGLDGFYYALWHKAPA
ncbi:16S rRNA (cytosine(967)-C(5))-methyltransferase RsmB [Aquabacterium sp. A08]|uniref:16S rRNA (cytosine(967)-C(5))-methyltransferase RsmB n=1 Tax=Aquabacterium sp. A08 TaxID=2718532 RepID=UPI00142323AC|nr:16S rRNA (cytosine(967)-C(5))-methyltransferase RsmB [Aquabacterium sp. A08]NIC42930.1 16S rRNA (cytosine(967)-C(5))-methyltransferase RsmB [Aquabacterium sp. A08]